MTLLMMMMKLNVPFVVSMKFLQSLQLQEDDQGETTMAFLVDVCCVMVFENVDDDVCCFQ